MQPTDSTRPDLIIVTEQHTQTVRSVGADVRVSFEKIALRKASSSPLTGPVGQLKAALQALGLSMDQVAVDRVAAESLGWNVVGLGFVLALAVLVFMRDVGVAAVVVGLPLGLRLVGLLSWPYKSKCHLRVSADDSALAGQVIDVVTAMPGAELGGVDWQYDVEPTSPDWVDECIARANTRAERIAKALGVEIVGVHRYAERWSSPNGETSPLIFDAGEDLDVTAPNAGRASGDVWGSVETTERAGVVVTVAYRVAGDRA